MTAYAIPNPTNAAAPNTPKAINKSVIEIVGFVGGLGGDGVGYVGGLGGGYVGGDGGGYVGGDGLGLGGADT
jgi:hypothetical protein